VNDVSVLAAAREVQIPLLAAVLITGCAAKTLYLIRTRTAGARPGPTATFPLGSRRPAATALCAIELVLGAGLLLTATLAWASHGCCERVGRTQGAAVSANSAVPPWAGG
jgi:hypothetical protein